MESFSASLSLGRHDPILCLKVAASQILHFSDVIRDILLEATEIEIVDIVISPVVMMLQDSHDLELQN